MTITRNHRYVTRGTSSLLIRVHTLKQFIEVAFLTGACTVLDVLAAHPGIEHLSALCMLMLEDGGAWRDTVDRAARRYCR